MTTHEEPNLRAVLIGIQIPGRYAAWIELMLIHLLVQNSSFMGHLAGIFAGIIYCNTHIGTIIDKIISCITGIYIFIFMQIIIYGNRTQIRTNWFV